MENEFICIKGLEVTSHIGVPDEERAEAQTLWVDVRMVGPTPFSACEDEVTRTIDYAAVALAIQDIAQARPRKLIETLAAEIRDRILTQFSAREVEVRIRKRILPNAQWVAVSTTGRA